MERFRIISDLHLDVNYNYNLGIKKDDVFTVIAGDTSGEQFIITHKEPKHVGFEIFDDFKFMQYVGKNNGIVKLIYNSQTKKWMYKDKSFDCTNELARTNIYIDNPSDLRNSDEITVKIINVEKWIKEHISKGILVAGNHIVYNHYNKTIEDLKENLANKFSLKSNISFLDNATGVMSKEVDGILFIGTTLYTDYEYVSEVLKDRLNGVPIDQIIDFNCGIASPKFSGGGLNDFNYGRTRECKYIRSPDCGKLDWYYLRPKNYLDFFNRSFAEIKSIVENNKDKDIVIVTHHGISPKCISKEYVRNDMNASYISNLEDFIRSHKNIKCWCCGHVHHRADFKIGQCRVVMNPLGYCKYGQFLKNKENERDWSFNTFVDTKTWTVSYDPFDINAMKATYEEDKRMREMAYQYYGHLFI